jgi:predicted ATPase
MITSLEVENFRCFRHLVVDGLKRFNIVVGDSGSGKTAFLEAFFVLGGANPEIWTRMRQWRGAGSSIRLLGTRASYESVFRDIFFDHKKDRGAHFKLVESSGRTRSLDIRYPNQDRYSMPVKDGDESRGENAFIVQPISFNWKINNREYRSKVEYKEGKLTFSGFDVVYPAWFSSPLVNDAALIGPYFSEQLSIKNKTEPLISAVREIFPFIHNLSLESIAGEAVLCVSVEGIREKLPLGNISSGLNKYVMLLISIAANPGGVMLIDEFETGFYYKNVSTILSSIFEFCKRHNVQIVATTHSYEFLQALLPIMKREEESEHEFVLLRSERARAGCTVKILGEPAAAIESNFEVR